MNDIDDTPDKSALSLANTPANTQANTQASLALTPAERANITTRKATCPFLGAAVAQNVLQVRNSAAAPLACIADIADLGNTGNDSNLGNLLAMFAQGNHAFMPGASGRLDVPAPIPVPIPVPKGTFSLDLPGSQGSHAGHSGILQGDSRMTDTGRFSEADFNRLLAHATGTHIARSALGKFIAENLARDPRAHVPGLMTAALFARDLADLVAQLLLTIKDQIVGADVVDAARPIYERLTKLLGEDNLLGSAGEFGLLCAFLSHSPNTKQVDAWIGHEPAYSVAELTGMFKDKQLPNGWQTWPKTIGAWVTNTIALAIAAERAR